MTTPTSPETMWWDRFKQAEQMLQTIDGEQYGLDLLYDLEIRELPAAVRILVNTTLVIADPQPDHFQKTEWLDEARVVRARFEDASMNNDEDQALRTSLDDKIRAAKDIVRAQMERMGIHYGFYDEEEYDEEEYEDEEYDEEEEDIEEDMEVEKTCKGDEKASASLEVAETALSVPSPK